MMMGALTAGPTARDGKTMEPLVNHGVQVMSIGFLVNPDQAMIWRGPIRRRRWKQLLRQTHWKDVDYLVVDMPPGTGDIQLTLSQRIITGAVIVTTPQDTSCWMQCKGITMFERAGLFHSGLGGKHGRACVLELRARRAHLWRGRAESWRAGAGMHYLERCRWI